MSRKRASRHMVVLGYFVTCGVGNHTEFDESGLFRMCQFFYLKNKAEIFVAHFIRLRQNTL